ncbi:MAG: imidazole glycerol phosphate synthase subunit HisH [Treponema sp.]|nr:imidazole glycerol phosphate synthase subunit HisH [Treponema sp.]
MTGIVDYNAGNITSVVHALEALNVPFVRTHTPDECAQCDRIIFPGDGDAAYAMEQLRRTGFDTFLRTWAHDEKPLLGICVGSQIIFDYSEEGDVACLGLLPGSIRALPALWEAAGLGASSTRKVPHMGWNDIIFSNGGSTLFRGIPERSDFYFIHSYVIVPEDEHVVKAYADYGIRIPACVSYKNITACQFHPEKSGTFGLQLLKNFCQE